MAFNGASSPAAALVEEIAGAWLKESLGLPAGRVVRDRDGDAGGARWGSRRRATACSSAPAGTWSDAVCTARPGSASSPARNATRRSTARSACSASGSTRSESVPTGPNGAVDPDALVRTLEADPDEPTIVCAQAGNVNTGAFDDLLVACEAAHRQGAWVHVDGAFGLWAAASPAFEHLVAGREAADSWVVDGHKWLNLPYDAGFVFCADRDAHAASMSHTGGVPRRAGEGIDRAPGLRARGLPRARVRDVGRAARARPRRPRRPGRALLRSRGASRLSWGPSTASRSRTTSCSTRSWWGSATTSEPIG